MTFEAVLASVHLLAILTLVVFLTSQAALCRAEWMSAAVVQRLARLDLIYGIAAVAVLVTGVLRLIWGVKGFSGYAALPLFHVKMTVFVVAVLLSLKPTFTFRRWKKQLDSNGQLPPADEVATTRKWVMLQGHVIPVIAVVAIFWARGM